MIEIFKEMILLASRSTDKAAAIKEETLRPLYVSSVIIEFFRALMENTIPQQASLQTMLIKFILDRKDYN